MKIKLLIVPYGIETKSVDLVELKKYLLIVPYGIETSLIESPVISSNSFNRTLWN